jgi:hypothetical protein
MKHTLKYPVLHILLIFQFFIILNGCERDVSTKLGTVNCNECYQYQPDWGPLNVILTINNENPYVPLVIYIGNIEDNNIEYVDTSYSSDYWVDVPVNKYYSITAEYKSGDKTIFAVDGDDFKLKYSESDCDLPCYYYYGGYYDLRLRN